MIFIIFRTEWVTLKKAINMYKIEYYVIHLLILISNPPNWEILDERLWHESSSKNKLASSSSPDDSPFKLSPESLSESASYIFISFYFSV